MIVRIPVRDDKEIANSGEAERRVTAREVPWNAVVRHRFPRKLNGECPRRWPLLPRRQRVCFVYLSLRDGRHGGSEYHPSSSQQGPVATTNQVARNAFRLLPSEVWDLGYLQHG